MKTNQAGIDLIKEFEGCRLQSYKDIVGVWTIGFGHTGADVYEHMSINEAMAEQLLRQDLEKFEQGVTKMLKVKIDANQFSALVSFAYNLGLGNLKSSTLIKCLNMLHYEDAAKEFLKWTKAGGKEVAGLVRRRRAEKDLFLKTYQSP